MHRLTTMHHKHAHHITCSVFSWSNKLETFPGTALEVRSSRKRCLWATFHVKNQLSTHRCSWSVTYDSGEGSSLEPVLRDEQIRSSRRCGTMHPEAEGKSVMETGGRVGQPCVLVKLETCVSDRASIDGFIMDACGWFELCKAWWNQAISDKENLHFSPQVTAGSKSNYVAFVLYSNWSF